MKRPLFEGLCTALVTPFDRRGEVDYDRLDLLVERQIAAGVNALLFCGTTGEGSALSDDELCSIFSFAVHTVQGRVPVIANIGSNNTAHSVELAKRAQATGVDGFLAITPYYNKTSQRGLVRHFEQLDRAVSKPILLYNVPSRTGMDIAPTTYGELAQLPNVVGVKEANADLGAVLTSLPLFLSGELYLYCGNDDLAAAMLCCGAKGLVSVLSNPLPAETAALCHLALEGKVRESTKLQAQLMPYIKALFADVNPIPVKYAMELAGVPCGGCRLPLCEPDGSLKKRMRELIWS